MSGAPEYISRIIAFLSQENAWNQSVIGDITNFLRKQNNTQNDVDSLIMTITKKVEARLRETLAKHLGRPIPESKSYGTRLLDYAVDSHLIPNRDDSSYALFNLISKEPRNTSHHTFANYPFQTVVMVLLEANEALQRIDTLIQPKYTSHLRVIYNPSIRKISIETQVFRPDKVFLPSDQKVDVTLEFPNSSVKTVPLVGGALNTWKGEYDVRGETCGSIACLVRGFDNGHAFLASSSSLFPIYFPTGQKCPNCSSMITSLLSICPNCGKALPVI